MLDVRSGYVIKLGYESRAVCDVSPFFLGMGELFECEELVEVLLSNGKFSI